MQQINASRFRQAEYERTVYVATVPHGTTIEDIQVPAYWAHVASTLKPFDQIEARAEDGTFWALFLVTECARMWAKTTPIQVLKLTAVEVPEVHFDGLTVRWRGPKARWGVIRDKDASVLRDQFATREEAELWAKDHLKALAA